jgi:hypothetical protein
LDYLAEVKIQTKMLLQKRLYVKQRLDVVGVCIAKINHKNKLYFLAFCVSGHLIITEKNRKTNMSNKTPVGSVLVVGGGITGMQSALDLADAGYYVYLVEESPAIGGAMAQLDKTFPTNDCSM